MTEVTRVPLRPIAKGSLTKLWLGVLFAVLVAGGLAWASIPKGLDVTTLTAGSGPMAQDGDVVFAKYVGKLDDGTIFDEHQPGGFPPGLFPEGTPFLLEEGSVIPGFYSGLLQTQKGGKYEIFIPAEQAYGAEPPEGAPIPANVDLTFEVEVVDIMAREDAERRMQAFQQMMQRQQGGAPGGAATDGAGPPAAMPAPPAPAAE
ncbi:MAG: FKBP-type peptidyl-prolyl cis-trans isomerase [Parerythrobacter sp.]